FIYTSCGDTCPLLSTRMQALQERLRQERLLGNGVQLLSFTVDPARDTVDVLRAYAERYQADPQAWRFLTGHELEVRQLVVQGFKLGVQPIPLTAHAAQPGHDQPAGVHEASYDVMHSNRIVLIDPQGRIRAYYHGLEVNPQHIVREVRPLLGR
ncbi:MAG TPA: SCO family protein, partial [Chloroflexota bacterium]|nr:SCO family protein [Chloroflexota bacterium]